MILNPQDKLPKFMKVQAPFSDSTFILHTEEPAFLCSTYNDENGILRIRIEKLFGDLPAGGFEQFEELIREWIK